MSALDTSSEDRIEADLRAVEHELRADGQLSFATCEALRCDAAEWLPALQDLEEFYGSFGSRLPAMIAKQLAVTRKKFGA